MHLGPFHMGCPSVFQAGLIGPSSLFYGAVDCNRQMVVLFPIRPTDWMEMDRQSISIQLPHRRDWDCVRVHSL